MASRSAPPPPIGSESASRESRPTCATTTAAIMIPKSTRLHSGVSARAICGCSPLPGAAAGRSVPGAGEPSGSGTMTRRLNNPPTETDRAASASRTRASVSASCCARSNTISPVPPVVSLAIACCCFASLRIATAFSARRRAAIAYSILARNRAAPTRMPAETAAGTTSSCGPYATMSSTSMRKAQAPSARRVSAPPTSERMVPGGGSSALLLHVRLTGTSRPASLRGGDAPRPFARADFAGNFSKKWRTVGRTQWDGGRTQGRDPLQKPNRVGSMDEHLLPGGPIRDDGALLLLMTAVSFASNALIGLVVPFLPHALEALRPTPPRLDMLNGCLMAVFPLTIIVTSSAVGWLLDKLGRLSVLRLGLVAQCLSTALFAIAPTIGRGTLGTTVLVFVIARIGQGAGACMSTIAIFAIIIDAFVQTLAATLRLNEVPLASWCEGQDMRERKSACFLQCCLEECRGELVQPGPRDSHIPLRIHSSGDHTLNGRFRNF
mmetsp:Transcript_13372/g.34321  ORF Transcript_13372/g.34321 Transcript_13372/m.34321 type:complete len:494 (+) Transcript_13372:418-1899(+)